MLVSESEEGFQNGLNVLSKFCSSWKLEVNTKKSFKRVRISELITYTPNFTSIQDDGDNQRIKTFFKKIANIV
jgi:hypothetical protein